MDYNDVRALVERWSTGSTTLAEERELRAFFADAADLSSTTPSEMENADLQAVKAMFRASAQAGGDHPARALVLRDEPEEDLSIGSVEFQRNGSGRREIGSKGVRRPLHRWFAVAAAAAIVAVAAVPFAVKELVSGAANPGQIVCMVDGVRVTDPARIEFHTREAIKLVNDNLRRPSDVLSETLASDPAVERVGKMLEQLTKTEIK